MHILMLGGCFTAVLAVQRQDILLAGWLLILSLLASATMLVLLGGQTGDVSGLFNAIPAYMLVIVVTSIVLPRHTILPIGGISAFLYGFSLFAFPSTGDAALGLTASGQLTSAVIIFLGAGVLLRQLRVEFDARLDAMSASIKQTELAREQAEIDRHRAEEADKAKSQFLANMSHELRTPLNAIIGYDEAMIGGMVGSFTPEQLKLLKNIQINSRRLLSLINDVLDLSKIESGSIEVYLSPISPRKVISDLVDSLQSLAHEQQNTLSVEFSESVPEVILGDSKKLQQILVNLLSNALKFTSHGHISVTVDTPEKNMWRFSVADTGIGMPEDATRYIFEPFKQVDGTESRRYKGTGLGLAITKRLVETLSGTIEVETELNKGSRFVVTLPRASVPAASEA